MRCPRAAGARETLLRPKLPLRAVCYVVAAARAAEVEARRGGFGGGGDVVRPKWRFVNSSPVSRRRCGGRRARGRGGGGSADGVVLDVDALLRTSADARLRSNARGRDGGVR